MEIYYSRIVRTHVAKVETTSERVVCVCVCSSVRGFVRVKLVSKVEHVEWMWDGVYVCVYVIFGFSSRLDASACFAGENPYLKRTI